MNLAYFNNGTPILSEQQIKDFTDNLSLLDDDFLSDLQMKKAERFLLELRL